MAKRLFLIVLLSVCGVFRCGQMTAAPNERPIPLNPIRFNIVFVPFCDGLDLRIRDRLGVTGTHTGCGFNERVRGDQFTTADGETGVEVRYFDQTVRRPLRIEIYRTGFRAGKFYVFEEPAGRLLRFGNWQFAPPAP